MITKFSINGNPVPKERLLIKEESAITQDLICNSIKAALQPFYELNDAYCERLRAIESKMYAFDQAMGKELRALQIAVSTLPNRTQYSLGDACSRIDKIQEKLIKMGDNINSILQNTKSRDTNTLERVLILENLILQIPGLKEAIEAQEKKERLEKEAEAFSKKEAFLNTLITELELTVRSHNCLKYAHGTQYRWGDKPEFYQLETVRDLIKYTRAQLLRIPNFGGKSLNEIKKLLASMDLKLA